MYEFTHIYIYIYIYTRMDSYDIIISFGTQGCADQPHFWEMGKVAHNAAIYQQWTDICFLKVVEKNDHKHLGATDAVFTFPVCHIYHPKSRDKQLSLPCGRKGACTERKAPIHPSRTRVSKSTAKRLATPKCKGALQG